MITRKGTCESLYGLFFSPSLFLFLSFYSLSLSLSLSLCLSLSLPLALSLSLSLSLARSLISPIMGTRTWNSSEPMSWILAPFNMLRCRKFLFLLSVSMMSASFSSSNLTVPQAWLEAPMRRGVRPSFS